MNPVIVEPEVDDYRVGVAAFLSSLGWTYVTYRYPRQAQGLLLRLLTLSGLDSWWWERYAMQLMYCHQTESLVLQMLTPDHNPGEPLELRVAVEEIHAYAAKDGASLGKPPIRPTYLAAFGYDRERYVADLRAVYGDQIAEDYLVSWEDAAYNIEPPIIQPVLLRQAAAIMGATAGAIERLMSIGGENGNRHGQKD